MEDEEEEVAEPKRRGRFAQQNSLLLARLDRANVCSSGSCKARSVKRTLSLLDRSLHQHFGVPLACMRCALCMCAVSS